MNNTVCHLISNYTYEQLNIGQSKQMRKQVSAEDILAFAAVSTDTNPAHLDPEYANHTVFKGVIAHGMYSAGLISALLGTRFPGFGTIYLAQELNFKRPVHIGDELTIKLTVTDKHDAKNIVILDCAVHNQRGEGVVLGKATVIAPKEQVTREPIEIPTIHVEDPPPAFGLLLNENESALQHEGRLT